MSNIQRSVLRIENKFGMQTDILSLHSNALNGIEIAARGKPITDCNGVEEVVIRSWSKYCEGDVKRFYMSLGVAIEHPI